MMRFRAGKDRGKTTTPNVSPISKADAWEEIQRVVDDVAEMHRLSRVLDIPFSEVLEVNFQVERELQRSSENR